MAENADAAQRRLIWIAASAVTTFYLYCVSILMALNTSDVNVTLGSERC